MSRVRPIATAQDIVDVVQDGIAAIADGKYRQFAVEELESILEFFGADYEAREIEED
ncbi:hypothetical protein LCGC14_0532330 [marine sediment metagenome]|uniref:Uncharacterized protein n=1 Tax=marine sediment metagenome TaxID=412755 RepID=A0A0F9RZZ7_9ZZZZ